ncbi:hypothetical protein, variant 2 [Aphanomyces invadans]|uniref:Uncharacterized protein n=1 Tax=Aphanomyces invadans TaxID=157072 RepID=A0A024TMI1_9STRA|nr:hypothetical protein, variant 2 [Aphanomyces invadans]ETV95345.1 hypothetical protein, variant 2 [Aphanomyces invadans]|eukprot:XP_008876046.1 hypothetical protein, variant 2 [Aphanomyces invadans]
MYRRMPRRAFDGGGTDRACAAARLRACIFNRIRINMLNVNVIMFSCVVDVDEGLIPTSSVVDVGQPQSVGRGKPSYCTSTPAASAYSTSVPLMVTAGMKRDLLQLGYSEADVNKMPPHIAHQILGAKLRKRHQPSSYTTRPSSAIPSSFPQHPTDSPADESDDVEVPFSPRTIAGCIALTIVILLLQFS